MRIVYLIGNGFDLKQGLETSYSSFYEFYRNVPSEEDCVREMKDAITGDIETWADLEANFGQHTSTIQSADETLTVFYDLVSYLNDYLEAEEGRIDQIAFDSSVLYRDLISPEQYLDNAEKERLNTMLEPFLGASTDIDILTFNYTKTIEAILDGESCNLPLGHKKGRKVVLQNVEHIHQKLGNSLVLGVNDKSQIGNKKFSDAEVITEVIVKPASNAGQGHGREEFCKKTIAAANLIVVFGSSIGDTDKIWWEQVGGRIGGSCSVILFDRGVEIDGEHLSKRPPYKRKIRDRFLSAAGFDEAAAVTKHGYVYVSLTDKYFALQKSQ